MTDSIQTTAAQPDEATDAVARGLAQFAAERRRADHFKAECQRLHGEALSWERQAIENMREVEALRGINVTLQGRLEYYMRRLYEIEQSIQNVVTIATDALVKSKQTAWEPGGKPPQGPRHSSEQLGIMAVAEALAVPQTDVPKFLTQGPRPQQGPQQEE